VDREGVAVIEAKIVAICGGFVLGLNVARLSQDRAVDYASWLSCGILIGAAFFLV
jgi:hypothetical protein